MGNTVIIDEQALLNTQKAIGEYLEDFMTYLDQTIASIEKNQSQWDDEDFEDLVNLVEEIKNRFLQLDTEGKSLISRIDQKLDAIYTLHHMKI